MNWILIGYLWGVNIAPLPPSYYQSKDLCSAAKEAIEKDIATYPRMLAAALHCQLITFEEKKP